MESGRGRLNGCALVWGGSFRQMYAPDAPVECGSEGYPAEVRKHEPRGERTDAAVGDKHAEDCRPEDEDLERGGEDEVLVEEDPAPCEVEEQLGPEEGECPGAVR